jgi:hypothetical protein
MSDHSEIMLNTAQVHALKKQQSGAEFLRNAPMLRMEVQNGRFSSIQKASGRAIPLEGHSQNG